jgi:NAD+ diphosphatase
MRASRATEIVMNKRFDLGPRPPLAYAASTLDRAAALRSDAAALSAYDAKAKACVIGGEHIILKNLGSEMDSWFPLGEARALAPAREVVFLGLSDRVARYAIAVDPAAVETIKAREKLLAIDLRSIAVQGLMSPDQLPPLAQAKAMLSWHARHRFCANCGAVTNAVDAGWRRDCPSCKAQHFPRTDPVVIMLAVSGDECLLGRQARFGTGMWSCLAGFVEPGETFEEAVRREVLEEAGIACGDVRYFAAQPWPFPMSLMIGCHAQALSREIKVDTSELEDARWFSRADAAAMLMRTHPDGLSTPPSIAIAYHIIRAWIEGAAFDGA